MSKSPVIVEKHPEFGLRLSVDDFFYPYQPYPKPGETETSPEYLKRKRQYNLASKRWQLFIWAFEYISALPHDDPWSFYQIGGIHGLPYAPYDNVPGQAAWDWGGYCTHGSVLFPTWHRPYVVLLEQSLIKGALKVLEKAGVKGEEDLHLAKSLRVPFFDWASPRSAQFGVPDIFTSPEIEVAYPYPQKQKIRNPLYSFLAPVDVKDPTYTNDLKNNPLLVSITPYEPADATPFLPANYPTVRYPDRHYHSQPDKLQMQFMRSVQWMLRPGVFAMLKVKDWTTFSNHFYDPTSTTNVYGSYTSIEVVHDMVHDRLGGVGGQMSYPAEAGLDPIFFFHHANVDRLLAIWQYCYPNSWMQMDGGNDPDRDGTFTIPPGSKENQETELTPFRKSVTNGKSHFWDSNGVRDPVQAFNYTYPEIVNAQLQKKSPEEMLKQMLAYYRPSSYQENIWYLNAYKIPKNLYGGPFKVLAFLQTSNDEALHLPTTDPRYAGEINVFSRGKEAQCANCRNLDARSNAAGETQGTTIMGSIDITHTMNTLHLDTDPEGGNVPPTENPVIIMAPADLNFTVALVVARSDGTREPLPKGVSWDVRHEFHEFDDSLSSDPARSKKRRGHKVAKQYEPSLFKVPSEHSEKK